ncbi:hypothetical protein BDW62DRAFT_104090 [Aspergillus aurantiobrunneus]
MDSEELGSYPVLMGVVPDTSSSVTFEHLESVDATEDTISESDEPLEDDETFYQPHTIRPLPIPVPVQKHPRQINCYHSTVMRQWRLDVWETCNNCGRKPFLRWFYLCTEDTSGYSAPIDQSGSLLNEWITEAILDGEYSDAQREKLIEQKLHVLEMSETEKKFPKSGSQFSAVQVTGHQYGYHSQAQQQSGLSPEPVPTFSTPQVRARASRCQYRACYHCDRKLQERTWLSLNEVCNDPNVKPPSAWDLWETPVSNASIVRNLGLRPPHPPPPPPPPPPHFSQHAYRASHRRRIRRNPRHYLGYESSLSVALMSNLSTIEEASEETITTDVHIETTHGLGTEPQVPWIVSGNREPEVQVSGQESEEDSDDLYS